MKELIIKEYEKVLRRKIDMIKDVALTYGKTKGATELSEEWGVSRQRIQQLAVQLRKKGIKIPRMRLKISAFKLAIKELKK